MRTIAEIGEALYGAQWHSALAGALGINRRTIQRWEADPPPPDHGAWADMARLCRAHAAALEKIAARLS